MLRRIVVIAGLALMLASCSSSKATKGATSVPGGSPTTAGATTTAAQPGGAGDTGTAASRDRGSKTVWLCRPGVSPDPCTSSLDATVVSGDGTMRVKSANPAPDPKIDCFYVYPTVSSQKTKQANLTIDPAETSVAVAQASRFSQVCRVFAPMYRQATLVGILGGGTGTLDRASALADVQAAWRDYLANDNHGRGVVLIGHSQGSFVLTSLIRSDIDNAPAVRKLLVSALLLGGNVMVPDGRDVGGSFAHVPVCRSTTQTGCVVAYSSFLETPPAGTIFGRGGNGQHVVCVNPAAPAGGKAVLDPFFPVGQSLLGGLGLSRSKVRTPWVEYPGLVTGECRSSGTSTWLQITDTRGAGDTRPHLRETLGPTWGLHLLDVNVAFGNLVSLAEAQAQAWKP